MIVEMVGKEWQQDETVLPPEINDYATAQKRGGRFYIAAQVGRAMLQDTFVLGDESICGGYYNAALKLQANYKIYIRGATEVNEVCRKTLCLFTILSEKQ